MMEVTIMAKGHGLSMQKAQREEKKRQKKRIKEQRARDRKAVNTMIITGKDRT